MLLNYLIMNAMDTQLCNALVELLVNGSNQNKDLKLFIVKNILNQLSPNQLEHILNIWGKYNLTTQMNKSKMQKNKTAVKKRKRRQTVTSSFSPFSSTPAVSATSSFSFGLLGAKPATSGFSFGTKPATSGFSFGTKPATSGFSFGESAGTSQLVTGPAFGTTMPATSATPTTSSFSFGRSSDKVTSSTDDMINATD